MNMQKQQNMQGMQQKTVKMPKAKKPKKKLVVILIIIIVLLLLCGGGYYFCRKKNITFDKVKTSVTQVFTKSKKNNKSVKAKTDKVKTEKNPVKTVNYTTYNWCSLNLRATPGGKKIYALNKNSLLFVEEENEKAGWLKVKVADKEGYISLKYTNDKHGFLRGSFKTDNLTKQCKKLIRECFTQDEQKILNQYEFRYMPDWIANMGAGRGVALKGLYCSEPKVIYFKDSTFSTAKSHDEIILHELCHAITPEVYGYNSPFANRLKVAAYKAGIKKVQIHLSKNELATVHTGL